MTDQRDRAASSDPIDRNEPIDPTAAIEPMLPNEATDPMLPIDSTEPFEPMHSSESCDHSDHFEDPSSMAVQCGALEGQHQPPAHAAGLEHPVRVGRLLGRERPRDPQSQDAVLGLLAQPV